MKILGLRKFYLYGLLFFVLPLGGLILYGEYSETRPHKIMRTFGKDGSIVLDYTCRPVGEFEDYLKVLNADAKLINTVCKFSGDVTTMIKMIECEVLHGPPQAVIYWAENLNECQKIEANFKKNKEEYGRINK